MKIVKYENENVQILHAVKVFLEELIKHLCNKEGKFKIRPGQSHYTAHFSPAIRQLHCAPDDLVTGSSSHCS